MLFPRAYAELTNELLKYVGDEDPELLERIFDRRPQRRLQRIRERIVGLPFPDRVRIVAQVLDEDGYLADFARRETAPSSSPSTTVPCSRWRCVISTPAPTS